MKKKSVTWECEWDENIKKYKNIQDFINVGCTTLDGGLSPKNAFRSLYRTRCFRSLYKCSEVEKIYDVTSLYSLEMARKPLPLGMPKAYKANFPDISNVHSLVDCTVEPPTSLKISCFYTIVTCD